MNRNNKPPRFAGWLMKRLSHQYHQRSVLGDLEEVYYEIAEDQGVKNARKWYWRQPLMSIKHLMNSIIYWSTSMFKNYLKVIFRNIKRNKGYSFLNITGLVIGISCSILIFLYIQYELSYDRYHRNADDIYRILIRQPG
ncbi:MAG: ABC transporter permease, partial [bacterium]|nr:ABC transporter permease [bacterium]